MRLVAILCCAFSLTLAATSFGYPREEISFSTRTSRSWLGLKQYIVEISSSQSGKIASLITTQNRSEIKYHFSLMPPQPHVGSDVTVFQKIANIRSFPDVFGTIGFPQLANLTRVNGLLFALVLATKVELEPESVAYIETDDPVLKGRFYESVRQRTGVSGSFGDDLGGVYPPELYDSAILVSLDGDRPEVLKVYDIIKSPLVGYDTTMHTYDTIYNYAYRDLVNMTRADSCEALVVAR